MMNSQSEIQNTSPAALNVMQLGVLFDAHFFNGKPTQIHFTTDVDLASTWVDEFGNGHLSINPHHIQFMSTNQLVFLLGHEYGHLVMEHPQKTVAIQAEFGIASVLDEFMLPPDKKRDYSKQMREMELQADLFGAQVAIGLGQDPVAGASFLLSQTKSVQHPEGTLRIQKIKSASNDLKGNDFAESLASVQQTLGGAPWFAQSSTVAETVHLKGVLNPGYTHGGVNIASDVGFAVPAVLTLVILAGALPLWWRRLRTG
ncbi:MAG TPA: M48 family metalloprotease [Limnobacter sp.]|nr:M48 family metalloprotease [Limnobacter sp.]